VYSAIGKWLNGKISDRVIKKIIMKEWQFESMDQVQSYLDWAAEDAYYDYAEEFSLPTPNYRIT